jgi:hypothetical protein
MSDDSKTTPDENQPFTNWKTALIILSVFILYFLLSFILSFNIEQICNGDIDKPTYTDFYHILTYLFNNLKYKTQRFFKTIYQTDFYKENGILKLILDYTVLLLYLIFFMIYACFTSTVELFHGLVGVIDNFVNVPFISLIAVACIFVFFLGFGIIPYIGYVILYTLITFGTLIFKLIEHFSKNEDKTIPTLSSKLRTNHSSFMIIISIIMLIVSSTIMSSYDSIACILAILILYFTGMYNNYKK